MDVADRGHASALLVTINAGSSDRYGTSVASSVKLSETERDR